MNSNEKIRLDELISKIHNFAKRLEFLERNNNHEYTKTLLSLSICKTRLNKIKKSEEY